MIRKLEISKIIAKTYVTNDLALDRRINTVPIEASYHYIQELIIPLKLINYLQHGW